ncbi:MAG: arginine--tRNA ligase, partial [Bacteroidetes bacterium]|nr:arginine--tRNA ligase [Bacteroidota bacterium]
FSLAKNNTTTVLEYCGPNTNKPLHLGHIRNMLLGYSTAQLLSYAGNDVHKVNIYNDRGIAICKSMLAYKLFGNGETPGSTGIKSDHFVGKYYVEFDKKHKAQIAELIANGVDKKDAEEEAPLMKQAREMLLQWEAGDKETKDLWLKMNNWCYEGFEQTYEALGVDFEKHYKESDYFEQGKKEVLKGLKEGKFEQHKDGSVWVDLEDKGLDKKILLRSDGTSVYITQDIGVAEARYKDYHYDNSIYVVADEQNYHFKVLKLTLEKLGKPYAEGIHHLSYGLVNLPDGRMKSREGTVVDADDLIAKMIATAQKHTEELGKVEDFTEEEAKKLYKTLAMGALKYFILKVNPKKSMIFNPEESIDFQGDTGPFVQFNYVRIQSLLRKQTVGEIDTTKVSLTAEEKELIKILYKYKPVIQQAAINFDVSMITSYSYELAKGFSKFYSSTSILNVEEENTKNFRLQLSAYVANTLKSSFAILGIDMPERM